MSQFLTSHSQIRTHKWVLSDNWERPLTLKKRDVIKQMKKGKKETWRKQREDDQ